jgi:hypothetical protein
MKKGNLLYIHIPRTAGTHFEKALGFKGHDVPPRCGSQGYGANYEDIMGWDSKTKIMLQHITYEQLIKHNFISVDNDLIKCTIVRNPYHRTISLFKYFGGEAKWRNFDNFLLFLETGGIKSYFYMPQWKYIQGAVFDVIKFEDFLPNIEAFKKKYDLTFDISFRSEEQSETSKKNFNKYYKSPSILNRVEKLYIKDFNRFNYPLVG